LPTVKELEAEIAKLKEENRQLKEENRQLREENREMREELSRQPYQQSSQEELVRRQIPLPHQITGRRNQAGRTVTKAGAERNLFT
jgi:cell division protein FtsB